MGISLDGTESFHNSIRGNKRSFYNVINTLEALKGHTNVDVLIATAIMKQNFSDVENIKQLTSMRFPNFEQKLFLATPISEMDFDFAYEDFPYLIDKCPELFCDFFAEKIKFPFFEKKHRCQGGVGHGVLTVDGIMKICPIAEEDVFIIGDIKSSSLYDVWVNPSDAVKRFRKEYVKSTTQCKRCNERKKCGNKNCRIEALRLTGNYLNPSPYTCMTIKGSYQE